jgi:predicted RNase H-like HicB family nuclease
MPTVFYPAVIERARAGFSVFFPDLPGCTSAGVTVTEAALGAEQALAGHVVETVRHGETLPPPSSIDMLEHDPDVDEIARVLVRVELPGKAVRLNITLDEALVAAIDKVARNRSGFLADAAREHLVRCRDREVA